MKFWKEHTALRMALMLATFAVGIGLLIFGWTMTGKLSGLVIMLVGVGFLLGTLSLYNKPFEEPKAKKAKKSK